jgi:hypothetical protein
MRLCGDPKRSSVSNSRLLICACLRVSVAQMEIHFWAGLQKIPEPISITNPTGEKLTENATLQTVKMSLRRQVLLKDFPCD